MSEMSRQVTPTRLPWHHDWLHMRTLTTSIKRNLDFPLGDTLDLGCGNRAYLPWLARARSYVGVDIDAIDSMPDITASAMALPFADRCFDTVVSFQVFEHLRQPWHAWHEIARVLRTGGRAIVTTHQAFRVHEAPFDYFRYTRYGLASLAQDAGLEVAVIEAHGGVWAMAGQALLTSFMSEMPGYSYPWLRPMILTWNLSIVMADALWQDQMDTMNYLIIAVKR